jgi:hypothetical protein
LAGRLDSVPDRASACISLILAAKILGCNSTMQPSGLLAGIKRTDH